MSRVFPVVVHHNPRCGTSRAVLALVEAAGLKPTVIQYMETGWTRPQLLALVAVMGASPRDLLRDKEPIAKELGLLAHDVADEAILSAMVEHPILVNRPIVATPKGVKLCRPAELVLSLLEKPVAATGPEPQAL